MADFQILTCPNCGGSGCSTCNNTGKVKVANDQMQKLKSMLSQRTQPDLAPQSFSDVGSSMPQAGQEKLKANFAGIIAFSLLSVIAGAAAASWWFLKTFKPFFAGLISLLILIGSFLASKQPFFQPQEPSDFLKAIKR